jgi:hypothetical protein
VLGPPVNRNPLVEIDCYINLMYSRSTVLRVRRSVKFRGLCSLCETLTQIRALLRFDVVRAAQGPPTRRAAGARGARRSTERSRTWVRAAHSMIPDRA